ncbi:hypothetical protein GCM10007103_10590 [Salinimicrobium marinum]|uniref:DUF1569 domain-containing protein n=1 Tax=Salinimicrobium marinum TaxID=680283 RepID=A0A918SAC2_9FLAO|nr:DUF1569 domain-containing protein [Salinimicrobium marinum]GHA30928.1 hypothetical protein GCM10007103_10590 [Salinimicrobium marinum]
MPSHIRTLSSQLEEMENYIRYRDYQDPKVSKAPVGWHLAHNLKVINNVLDALEFSDPKEFKSSFSFIKTMVMMTGHIPRGKAKSPKVVLPPDIIEKKNLILQLEKARQKISTFNELDKNAFFDHPYFYKMNKKESGKFLTIHTKHHLKIIKDITTGKNQ